MRKGMRKPALLAALAVAVSVLCTGCSEKPDEKAYVRAALDAIYHRECGAYAELLHISENQAEEEIEKTYSCGRSIISFSSLPISERYSINQHYSERLHICKYITIKILR